MRIEPFILEEWMQKYEGEEVYNLDNSCVYALSLIEFKNLIGIEEQEILKIENDSKIIELAYNAIKDVIFYKKRNGITKCYKLIIKTNRKNLKFFVRSKENYFFGESDENGFYILENFYFFLKDKIEK